MKYEILEHPADLKIRAYGKDLGGVFINMALAMMEFIYGRKVKKEGGEKEAIMAKGDDQESLLVNWLSEILYLSVTNKRAFADFKILELENNFVKAEAFAFKAVAADDIKAVTYNGLKIEKMVDGWAAEVVFDI